MWMSYSKLRRLHRRELKTGIAINMMQAAAVLHAGRPNFAAFLVLVCEPTGNSGESRLLSYSVSNN